MALLAVDWPMGSPSTGIRAMKVARSVAEVLSRHTTLTLECVDRMYLNVYVPLLQAGAGVAHFFRKMHGRPVPSSALMAPMTQRFVEAIKRYAERNRIDIVSFRRGERIQRQAVHQRARVPQAAVDQAGHRLRVARQRHPPLADTLTGTEGRRAAAQVAGPPAPPLCGPRPPAGHSLRCLDSPG